MPPAPPLPNAPDAPEIRFRLDGPHGRLVGVSIPAPVGAPPPPAEQAFTSGLGSARQASFTAGRLALRLALADLGLPTDQPLLPDARGAPTLPAGCLGSISHKRTCAVGLAAPAESAPETHIGVDLEELRPLRADIGRRVLTPGERQLLAHETSTEAHDRFVLTRFSLKEAFYKAVNAFVGPSVSFQAVEITEIRPDGSVSWRVPLLAEHGLAAEGWLVEISGLILTSVQVRRGPP
jgi:4'-phosphopantetheinyl transferase EntD